MSLLAFEIRGTVEADGIEDACRTISTYLNPDDDRPDEAPPFDKLGDFAVTWDDA